MSSELLDQLANFTSTAYDVRVLRTELAKIKESLFGTGNKGLEAVLKEQVRSQVASILGPALQTAPGKVVDDLLLELKALPVLRLSIAFEPTQSSIELISHWLQTQTEKRWVLELVVDPKVGAGTIMEVNGLYRDFSLHDKIDQAVKQATQHFFEKVATA